MTWCVEYLDEQQRCWNVGLVSDTEAISQELATWLNGLGWQARVTRQVEVRRQDPAAWSEAGARAGHGAANTLGG